ncbi:MAG: DUF922 domain-containing protein [Aquaticitalea sp.]
MFYKTVIAICLSAVLLIPMNDKVISWRDDLKLTWTDFKGPPKAHKYAVAVTASGITFEFSVKELNAEIISFDTKVEAHFYPDKSWYIKKEGTPQILAHEQLHFDITELYARKFRQQIAQLKVNGKLKTQLRELHLNINKELALAQNLYDQETDNSVNRDFQAKWVLYVEQELAKLEAYKSKD